MTVGLRVYSWGYKLHATTELETLTGVESGRFALEIAKNNKAAESMK